MRITDIDLNGLGHFESSPATFTINRYHLPRPWEYQHYNGQSLLRLRHDGGAFFQIAPPGGPLLLNHTDNSTTPAMMVWIIPQGSGPKGAFSNFWSPRIAAAPPGAEPQRFTCTYSPAETRYELAHDRWLVQTRVWLAPDSVTLVSTLTLTNTSRKRRSVTLMPVIRPHLAAAALAPWDIPAIYQTTAFMRLGQTAAFWAEMRDPGGNPAKRLRAAIVTDLAPTHFEVSPDAFVGQGRWDSPQAVWQGQLQRNARRGIPTYGKITQANAAVGRPPLAAMARQVELAPGASFQFTTVLAKLPETVDGKLPPKSQITRLTRYFDDPRQQRDLRALKQRYDRLFNHRRIDTPDDALNHYVNEHLALQLEQMQDRGWCNMRGVRDTAQDATAIVPVDPALARDRLLEILSLERSDGWFLRQYSLAGRHAQHDARPYVDSGLWVWALLWEYLVWTRDFALLKQNTSWLDAAGRDSVMTHAQRLLAYYLDRRNLGEHGLCKIREGDWNDSVNAAGLEGRGESVMVPCQLVLALEQAAELLEMLGQDRPLAKRYRRAAQTFRRNLLKHARNRVGYFNGVFTDGGQWVFSPRDPDGAGRVNSTPNSFAIIAGIVKGKQRDRVVAALESLKGPYGWRLFHPPIGQPPIHHLGRIGQGDLAAGLGENGTPYNHGSHGFLGAAAWHAGRGELLYHVMRYMLPYDQQAHPVLRTRSAPYLVVNHYMEAPGLEGVGGAPFNTGSVPVAVRNCFDGFLGFRPGLRHLVIDPVIRPAWKHLRGHVTFMNARYDIEIQNPHGRECGVRQLLLDGQEAGQQWMDARLDRRVIGLPLDELRPGEHHAITATL
ncbi:MAG: hypothetical protein WD042_18230 [Phycisphaeraceae bacterium]